MAITKDNIKEVLKRYMKQNNLGYVHIEASLSVNKSTILMLIDEDEDEIDTHLLN